MCKPAWFDVRARELEAADAVGDVLGWLGRGMDDGASSSSSSSVSVGNWTHANVATELGGWLRALDRCNGVSCPQASRTHRLFSYLPWSVWTVGGSDVLEENEGGEVDGDEDGDEGVRLPGGMPEAEERKGWLEDDDIEDVE